MHVALIGLGEVGRCYAAPLRRAGYALGLCEARPSPAATALAQSLGLPIRTTPGEWLREADWVLSCVPGSVALSVAGQVAPCLRPGATLADMSTASPETKREAAAMVDGHAGRYLDVAIMGGILAHRERTPLLASGPGAPEFARLLEPTGARVGTIEGGGVGDAMALKILRSVFTKGMEALSVELLVSAEKQGVRGKLYQQLLDIDQTRLQDFIEMLVRTHVVHAARRAHEVHDARQQLSSQGAPSVVLPGVQARFEKTARALQSQPLALPEPTIEEALGWLLANAG